MKVASSKAAVFARSTPHGFWRFSANYLLAARRVEAGIFEDGQLFFPTLQLYGTSIELCLKAFLLKRGKSLTQVKTLNHNLTQTLALARHHKLGLCVKLDRREIWAVQALDITYSKHQLRYIVSGVAKVPQLVDIARVAEKLVIGLEQLCTGTTGRLN